MPHRRRVLATVVATLLLTLAGCSDSDGGSSVEKSPTSAPAGPEPLRILVSNDDSYAAPGIDVLVEALLTLDAVEVTVVAPLEERSGAGGKVTDGEVAVTDVETAGGYPAKAVDGFPADAVRVAIDELDIEADLVVTGINSIQNLGPLLDVAGIVGAARAAVARDVPAFATSQGIGDSIDYEAAVPYVLDWITEHRDALAEGDEPVAVNSLNVPSCASGKVRGLAEVKADPQADPADALAPQDCTSTEEVSGDTGDVAAFQVGYATISTIPSKAAD